MLEKKSYEETSDDIEVIGVAIHGGDRCQCLEFVEEVGRTHVAPVEDVIDFSKVFKDFGVQLAVRVRDDSQPHLRFALPSWNQVALDPHLVEDALDDEVDQILNGLWTVVEARCGGNHDGAGFGGSGEIPQMDQ